MIEHIDWLTALTSTVQKYSKVNVEDYIDRITTPGVPMDFVAITVLCRIYHIHVGVFFNNGAWSTCRDKHLKSSCFGIVFHGNLKFTETVRTGWTDKYHEWIVSRTVRENAFTYMYSHAWNFKDGTVACRGSHGGG